MMSMIKKFGILLVIGTACLAWSSVATADTITFSGLPTTVSGPGTYTEGNITAISASGTFWAWPTSGQLHADPSCCAGATFSFTYAGGAFNFTSVDIPYASGGAVALWTGYNASNAVVATYSMNAGSIATGLTPGPGFNGIWKLTVVDQTAHWSIDNLTLTATSPAVPEPASLLLFGTGLGVLGFAAWRRRK